MVKAGYKQTEVGIIPADWEVVPLYKIVKQLSAGVSVNSEESDTYDESITSILKTSSVYEGRFIPSESKRVIPKDVKRVRLSPCIDNIIVSRMNTPLLVGECGYIDGNYPNIFVPDRLWVIEIVKEKINAKWLASLLSYSKFRSVIKEIATGTSGSMKNIAKSQFLAISIPYPQKEEQIAIATALSDVDALIASLNAQIAKKRDIKTATMQQLLTGKQRLAGFGTGKGMKPSELGEIPEDWEVVVIGEIASVKTGPFGSALHEEDYVEDGIPIITVEHLGELGITYKNLPKVSDGDWKRLSAYQLKIGDIAFSRVGSIDRNALIKSSENGWLFSGRLLRVRLHNNRNVSTYLSYHFHSEPFKNRVIEIAVGQTMPSLNTKLLKNVKVLIPVQKEEQAAIAGVLSAMDEEIAALEQRLAKTKAMKQGMMQELLTGRTRLV